MIITEKQIMRLMDMNRNLTRIVMASTSNPDVIDLCTENLLLLNIIANQQSDELKDHKE